MTRELREMFDGVFFQRLIEPMLNYAFDVKLIKATER